MIKYEIQRGLAWVDLDAEDVRWEVRDEAESSAKESGEMECGGQTYRWRKVRSQGDVGYRVGKAIARDTLAEGYDREWTGLDPQDADQFLAVGLLPGTAEWDEQEAIARIAYSSAIQSAS